MTGSQPFNGLPLHIDCPTGVAGDMLLAALLDLGVPAAVIESALADLGLAGLYQLSSEERCSAGLRGLRITVTALEPDPPHRQWLDIRQRIEAATLNPALQQRVLAVFEALAQAEATVHGTSPDSVHFHEVGAMDALVDVVGVCAAMEHLAPLRVTCTAPPAGHGSVRSAHGQLPVPVPAVLELARRRQIPLRHDGDLPAGELTTPTGLALLSVLVDHFSPPQRLTPGAIGIGLGHRELDRPNLLRLIQLKPQIPEQEPASSGTDGSDPVPRWQPLVVQEAWIDDATPEDLALLLAALQRGGAVDAASTPLQMKKGRPGQSVTALVLPDRAAALREIWFGSSPTIGLRERDQGRWLLPRRNGILHTPWGALRAKQVRRPDGSCTVKPEADDLQRLSQDSGQTIAALRASHAGWAFSSDQPWSWT